MPLTANGYVKRTAAEIKSEIIASLQQTIPEFTQQNADLQSNLIDTSIEAILQYENMMNALFNAYSPDYANDDIFMKFAESLGLRQRGEFSAQTTLTFKGKYGDFIPKGTIVTNAAGTIEFTTQENIVCDTTGTAMVLALSETEEICEAGTLTTLKTIINDGVTVTNEVASLKYISAETTSSLKARAQAKLRSVRQGGKMYADSLLRGTDGVDYRLIAFYDKSMTQRVGGKDYLIKGIECVIGGGDDSEVAKALYLSFIETQKLISSPSDGDMTRKKSITLYIHNNPVTIEYTRPKVIQLSLRCKISFTSTLVSPVSLQQLTQSAMTSHINNLKVGLSINKFSLQEVVLPLIVGAGMPAHTIKSLDFQYNTDGSSNWLEFDTDGKIPIMDFDCYAILNNFVFEVNA